MMTKPRTILALAFVLLTLAACGDTSGPGRDEVAGTYTAVRPTGTFTITEVGTGQSTDLLAQGGSLTLTLSADGTTSGRLVVPDGAEGGGDLDASMAGTWTLDGSTVELEQNADTFVRDLRFSYRGGSLEAEETFGGSVRVRVVLVRE